MNHRRSFLQLIGISALPPLFFGKQAQARETKTGLPTDGDFYLTTMVRQVRPDGRPLRSPTGIGVAYEEGKQIDIFVRSTNQWQYLVTLYTKGSFADIKDEDESIHYENGRWVGEFRGSMRINWVQTTLTQEELVKGGLNF